MAMTSQELFVFASRSHAMSAGFGGAKMMHPQLPDAYAWWPAMNIHQLFGRRFHRVNITDPASRALYYGPRREPIREVIASRLTPNAVWLDL